MKIVVDEKTWDVQDFTLKTGSYGVKSVIDTLIYVRIVATILAETDELNGKGMFRKQGMSEKEDFERHERLQT